MSFANNQNDFAYHSIIFYMMLIWSRLTKLIYEKGNNRIYMI